MTPTEASKKKEIEVLNNQGFGCKQFQKHKFEVGDMVRVSRLKGIFKKGYLPNWSEEVFEIVKVNRTKPITYIIKDAHDEIIKGSLYNEELQKTNQEVYRIERVKKEENKWG